MRVDIPKVIRATEQAQLWSELVFLYVHYDEFDNAALAMMERSADAWEHNQFKEVVVKVANIEIYYKVRSFLFEISCGADELVMIGAQLLLASTTALAERSPRCSGAENRSYSSCQDVPESRRVAQFVLCSSFFSCTDDSTRSVIKSYLIAVQHVRRHLVARDSSLTFLFAEQHPRCERELQRAVDRGRRLQHSSRFDRCAGRFRLAWIGFEIGEARFARIPSTFVFSLAFRRARH